MPGRRLIWAVLASVLVGVSLAEAQERRELSVGAGEAPVTVFADRIESLERDRLLIAEGRVEIEQQDIRLEADRVEVNTETGEAVAAGRVVFFDGRDRLTGERIEYNLRTGTGIVYRAEGRAEPHFFFAGDRMERLGEKAYRLTGGLFTTCTSDPPAWSITWREATAYLDEYMWGRGATFWVWRLPLIPYVPLFAAPLRRDRQTGFLAPSFGTSDQKGFSVRLPFFWAISDSQDLTLVPTWYEKRGFGLGAMYRYVRRETSRGEVEGFYLWDTERDDDRWVVGLRHEESFTPRLTLRADLAAVSDDQYFEEFGGTLDDRSRQRLESNLSVSQRWERWSLFGRFFYYEDLTTETDVELQRLPEIRLSAFKQPVPGLGDLLFEGEVSYVNFVRDVGAEGQRLDVIPRLSYPISPGGYFTLTPRVGVRETIYDRRVVGTGIEEGFSVQRTETEALFRTLFEAGVQAEARAMRIFETGGALGVQRLQHVVEPRVAYSYVSDPDRDDIPQFDGVDAVRSTNLVTYSLTNRLKARAPGTEEQPGRVWEMVRFAVSQSYDLDENVPGRPFSDVLGDLIVEPTFGIRLRGAAALDPYEGQLTSATTDVSYYAATWGASLGTRHTTGGDLTFVQGSLQARLGQRWAFRVSSNYNVQDDTVVENRLEVDFREQCWGITVSLVDRVNEDEVTVTVNLLELGHWGFGRAFTSQ